MKHAAAFAVLVLIFNGCPTAVIAMELTLRRRGLRRPRLLHTPAADVAVLLANGYLALEAFRGGRWDLLAVFGTGTVLQVIVWWLSGGDDQWKKLKRRIAERIAATAAGRLAVVPT